MRRLSVCFSGNLKKMADVEEDLLPDSEVDFPPDFKDYIEMELKYSRLESSDKLGIRWVFWNRQDDANHSVDSVPHVCSSREVRLNIRHTLHKLISHPQLNYSLVQFWAPTKTLEGRTLLTTQFQPFALGKSYYKPFVEVLCEYRMGMCRKYNFFYADAESGEEQLGLPGRVFLRGFPESTPDVKYYTLKEYPQRDLALRCGIKESWALPVFENSSHTCVGVLELACLSGYDASEYWYDEDFLGLMYDIFQEFGLQCFDGHKLCKMQYRDTNKALTAAYWELKMAYESACKIHNLPLALTWVSCRSFSDLLQCQFQFSFPYHRDKDNCDLWSWNLHDFMEVSKVCHLRKGQLNGRILPFPNLLYCSDVKQFNIVESPLVPYARYCRLGGCFTMCLQSSYTGDELYMLEFFLPASNENDGNILTRLRLILDTMEECFKTFKLASGQEWGELLSVEVIDFQNDRKSHSIQMIPDSQLLDFFLVLDP